MREPFHPWFYGNEVTLYVLLYSYARRSSSRVARWGWLAGPVVFGVQGVGSPEDWDVSDLVFDGLVFGIAWLAGRTVRRFDDQARALRETLTEIEHEQRAREASAVAAERTRIAAEMHDVVAHAVSLMVVQVGATRIRLEKDGRRRSGLDEIEEAGRQALDELRRMLGVLREPSGALAAPLPGVGALPDLVAGHAARGLRIELEVGPLGDLPDATALAVYRIVQDALEQDEVRGHDDIVSAVVRRDGDDILVDVGPVVPRHRAHRGVHVLLSLRDQPARVP